MIVTSERSSKDVQFLDDQINEHNVMRTGRRDFQPLGVFVRGDDGSIIAGLDGFTWGGRSKSNSCGYARTCAVGATAAACLKRPKPRLESGDASTSGLTATLFRRQRFIASSGIKPSDRWMAFLHDTNGCF